MAKKKNTTKTIINEIISLTIITVGVTMAAAALQIFLIPNSVIDGGMTGISIILSKLTPMPLSMFVLLLNIPFLLIGYNQLGKKFLLKTAYGMILFSCLLSVFEGIYDVTNDIILASIYGGIILGIGVGLVIKAGGCLDGTEIIAILINKHSSLSVGQVVLFFNVFIYGAAMFVFGPDRALYSLLTYFITFKLIDLVSEGMDQAKAVTIITNKSEDISKEILKRLGRNVTIMNGNGLMNHPDKVILYVVITRIELPELKEIIKNSDADCFTTISDISEILGPHVKRYPRTTRKKKTSSS